MGDGDIRSLYVDDSVSVHYILGYDVPTCGSRVPFVYTVYVYLLYLFMLLLLDIYGWSFGWCVLYRYKYVSLVVGIGRESAFGVFICTE